MFFLHRSYALSLVLFLFARKTGSTQNVVPYSAPIYISNNEHRNDYNAAVAAVCPGHAPVSCDGVGHRGWCCPSSQVCVDTPNLSPPVNCCPQGATCGDQAVVQNAVPSQAHDNVIVAPGPVIIYGNTQSFYSHQPTITQVQYATRTEYYQFPTTTVVGDTDIIVAGGPVVQNTPPPQGQYCSTLTAHGPGLPTTRAGGCGTILVVNAGSRLKSQWIADWCSSWGWNWEVSVISIGVLLGLLGWL